jgi:hypothetical protein
MMDPGMILLVALINLPVTVAVGYVALGVFILIARTFRGDW